MTTHEHLLRIVKRLPSDFEPHGNRSREQDWGPDCSCSCRYFLPLAGNLRFDWGVCAHPQSPRCGLLTFEHMGCTTFEADAENEPVSRRTHPEPSIMARNINNELDRIEREHEVKILYACESGSRGWGFASHDSDYDVRFLYIHTPTRYLSLRRKRDVIEAPEHDKLDVTGWDIRKALLLLRKSNPPLLEWLQAAIIYRERYGIAEEMRALIPAFYSPRASWHHYLHMAEGNYRDYLKGDYVWVKKYFYVLRPILACRWIEQNRGVVPMEFANLVDKTVADPGVTKAIKDLISRKRQGDELSRANAIPEIGQFIEIELERLSAKTEALPASQPDPEHLDEVFLSALQRVFGPNSLLSYSIDD